jgi:PatG Domain
MVDMSTEDQAPSSETAVLTARDEPAVSGPASPVRGLAVPAAVPAPPEKVGCTTCGSSPPPATLVAPPVQTPTPVVSIGTITSAFPSLSVEKEFAQLLGQKDFTGFTDRQSMHSVLSQPENRYLARRMCFLLTAYGTGSTPAYVLMPELRDDLDLLIDTLKRPLSAAEFDVVKGQVIGIAPPALCNGQQLPILSFYQLYSFGLDDFQGALPRPDKMAAGDFKAACDEFFHRALRLASNASGPMLGLSYAILSYAGLYKLIAEKYQQNYSLVDIEVRTSRVTPGSADIWLKFVERQTGFSETYCFTVNHSGPFAFLEEPLHPCFGQ